MELKKAAEGVKAEQRPWQIDQGQQDRSSDPYGTRTRVAGVKGRCPRPLDEGAAQMPGAHTHYNCRGNASRALKKYRYVPAQENLSAI